MDCWTPEEMLPPSPSLASSFFLSLSLLGDGEGNGLDQFHVDEYLKGVLKYLRLWKQRTSLDLEQDDFDNFDSVEQ